MALLSVVPLLPAGSADAYTGTYDREYLRIHAQQGGELLHADAMAGHAAFSSTAPAHDLASHWYLVAIHGTDNYQLLSRASDMALSSVDGTPPFALATPNSSAPAQAWSLQPQSDHFLLSANGGTAHAVVIESLPHGAAVPWIRYDEDNLETLQEPAHVVRTSFGAAFDRNSAAAEADKGACVILNGFESFARWRVREQANALVLRYLLQDGDAGTITLRIEPASGGTRTVKVPVNTAQSWVYFENGTEHSSPAAGRIPGKRYSEARLLLDQPLQAGDAFAFVRASDDVMIWIDLVELEWTTPVGPPTDAPYYDVTQAPWNAKGDGVSDDYFAITNCLNDAARDGRSVYLPAGTYALGFELFLPSGTRMEGAGFWHTELRFTSSGSQGSGGIRADGNHYVLRNLYLKGSQTSRYTGYKGIKGNWGSGSLIENIWVEETETGMWIADYHPPLGQTDGLVVRNSRFRSTFADGINMAEGTRNSVVDNCHIRGAGDDGIASWASGRQQNHGPTQYQKFRYNTIEAGYRAGGIGLFGGGGHVVHHNLVTDQIDGAGIRLNTIFIWLNANGPQGYPFNSSGDPIRIYQNTLLRTGARTLFNEDTGALDLVTRDTDVENIRIADMNISQSTFSGIRFAGYQTLAVPLPQHRNVELRNILIEQTPVAIAATGIALGSVEVRDLFRSAVPTNHSLVNGFALNQAASLASWKSLYFGSAEAPTAGSTMDPNRNGIANLLEFFHGSHPNQALGIPTGFMSIAPGHLSVRVRNGGHWLGNPAIGWLVDGVRAEMQRYSADGGGTWLPAGDLFRPFAHIVTTGDGSTTWTLLPADGKWSGSVLLRLRVAEN
jgi:hypothetical protein